jgi:prepilin-type N-terminal cleavage/methylation domain-containing protein
MFYRGFTLIEVVLVITILVVIAGLGVPVLQGTLANQRLRSSADQLRGEIHDARIKAMEEGQVLCLRLQLGGSKIILDRILDAHFTAGLSSRDTTNRFNDYNALDPFERGAFTGETEDFILRDPSQASEDNGAKILSLPETVFAADVIAVPEERAAFYLGLTTPGETTIEENAAENESVTNQEIRLGETSGSEGSLWSTPIFFYPDGQTSAAAILLKNESGRCIEIRLRGLTGISKASDISSVNDYRGELDTSRITQSH